MTYVAPVAKLLTTAQLSTVHLHLIHDHIDIMNKATPTQKSTDLIRIEMVAVTVLVILNDGEPLTTSQAHASCNINTMNYPL